MARAKARRRSRRPCLCPCHRLCLRPHHVYVVEYAVAPLVLVARTWTRVPVLPVGADALTAQPPHDCFAIACDDPPFTLAETAVGPPATLAWIHQLLPDTPVKGFVGALVVVVVVLTVPPLTRSRNVVHAG